MLSLFNTPLDDETKEHIANALWMRTFEPEKLEEDVVVKLKDTKNSEQSIGTRMNAYLDWLLAHPQSHNPSYELRYSCLLYTSPSPRDGLLSRMPSSA